ncbi:glycosyl transferase family 2 [Winogradskyella sp. J14-2]|uniref:glycosyltransferase family 2 protein n=1 Tax=Winogradskyella sp. J14-2 TaxID=1936080 RepID=UPI000972AFDB|nr:glycosyltransferase [Winogradskyella sp. J14-2]APY07538.1 glycosyl transferase family 2 [Winogradskyella sp. J14-2]
MNFSLIICTYNRSLALEKLLKSVLKQTLYPNYVLIIDASENEKTKHLVSNGNFINTEYYKVGEKDKGLTKQRNYGISKLEKDTEVVCFLDDDTILEPNYFNRLINTYKQYPTAIGVGGYITNEVDWHKRKHIKAPSLFCFDGYCRIEPLRFRIRAKFGLQPDRPPCYLPTFGHGRSVSFLPPTGKTYEVELFMGGVASYRTEVFDQITFSEYFEGYGLYEDADFCLRLSKIGKLYVNTSARLGHYHEPSGRPSTYKYGKMVVRNGWYVWRVKYNNVNLKSILKWYATEALLMVLAFISAVKSKDKVNTAKEGFGRFVGLLKLIVSKPKINS